jgi:hypothetical protein
MRSLSLLALTFLISCGAKEKEDDQDYTFSSISQRDCTNEQDPTCYNEESEPYRKTQDIQESILELADTKLVDKKLTEEFYQELVIIVDSLSHSNKKASLENIEKYLAKLESTTEVDSLNQNNSDEVVLGLCRVGSTTRQLFILDKLTLSKLYMDIITKQQLLGNLSLTSEEASEVIQVIRKVVIQHEIGHCLLNLKHVDQKDYSDYAMMRPKINLFEIMANKNEILDERFLISSFGDVSSSKTIFLAMSLLKEAHFDID